MAWERLASLPNLSDRSLALKHSSFLLFIPAFDMNREEVKFIVREVVREILDSVLAGSQPERSEEWVDAKKAWEPLGYPSYSALYKAIQSGLWREGREIRDRRKPGARIARWQVNLAAAQKRLLQDPSKRRGV